MNSKDLQRIHHIKAYCDEVADTIKRYGLGYEIFLNDKDYYKSVSMTIMQIGELSIGLSDEFKNATKSQMLRRSLKKYQHENSEDLALILRVDKRMQTKTLLILR